MRKDTILCLCSPDIDRLHARRAIGSVKASDLSRAELYVFDNAHDRGFNHSAVMNDMLTYAARTERSLVILDDDVEITRYDWLDRLHDVSGALDADIVGCVHTMDDGRPIHLGETIDADGISESLEDFVHDPGFVTDRATYVPALCSAIMLITNCQRYVVDVGYLKYKQDLDLCLQAWAQGRKVAVALDVRLTHNRGVTGERNPQFARILSEDSVRFARKWASFLPDLFAIPALQQYGPDRLHRQWHRLLLRAARFRHGDPAAAAAIYRRIIAECLDPEILTAAHFHLFGATGDVQHLRRCNEINPCHRAARQQLESHGLTPANRCDHGLDCRTCRLGRVPGRS